MKCTQCGSDDIIDRVRVVDRGDDGRKGDLAVEVERNPTALIQKSPISAPVAASICGACGNVMLSVEVHALPGLRQAAEVRSMHGKTKDHPRWADFVSEDPARKHLESTDQIHEFAAWLRKHHSGKG